MHPNATNDALVLSLEQERLAIWNSFANDQERQAAWAHRKAALLSFLLNDPSVPRSLPYETQYPVQPISEAGQYACARSSFVPGQHMTGQSFQNEPTYSPLAPNYIASVEPSDVRVYDPATYVSRLPQLEHGSSMPFTCDSTRNEHAIPMQHTLKQVDQQISIPATQIMTPSMSESSQQPHLPTPSSRQITRQRSIDAPATDATSVTHSNVGLLPVESSPFLPDPIGFDRPNPSTATQALPDLTSVRHRQYTSMIDPGDTAAHQAVDMRRTDTTLSSSSPERHSSKRRRKQIENSRKIIAPKAVADGGSSSLIAGAQRMTPQISSSDKEAITRAHFSRPAQPKLYCNKCDEYPNGFRGDHELRRHCDRAHAELRKVWICVEPSRPSNEGWLPTKPVSTCKQCKNHKHYNVYYNAAAHLRRAHFCPRKRGRRPKGEPRESRAGKAGGDWPPIDWLKANGWLKEIEVSSSEYQQSSSRSSVDHTAFPTAVDSHQYPTYVDVDNGYPTPVDMGSWHDTFSTPVAPTMEHTVSAPPHISRTSYLPHGASPHMYESPLFGMANNTPYAH